MNYSGRSLSNGHVCSGHCATHKKYKQMAVDKSDILMLLQLNEIKTLLSNGGSNYTNCVGNLVFFLMARSSCFLLNFILKTRLVIFLEHKHQHHNLWSMLPLRITGIRQSFQQTKVNYWIDHIEKLALIVKSQPHVAYSAWTSRKMTYALRSSQFTSETL